MTTASTARQIADALHSMKGLKMEEMLQKLGEQFADASQDDVERGFGIAGEELEERAKTAFAEAESLSSLAFVLSDKPEGVSGEDHIRAKAKAGDPFAVAYVKQTVSTAYKIRSALFDAAIQLHPDWKANDDGTWSFVGAGSPPKIFDETALIDWFQINYPQEASNIEDTVRAGGG